MRLNWNTLAWLLVAATLIVAGLMVYTFFVYRRAAIDLLIERDRQVAHLSAARLRDELSAFPAALQRVARDPELLSPDVSARARTLQRSSGIEEGLFDGGVFLLDNLGNVIASAPPRPEILGQNWADREYFRRLLVSQESYFSDAIDDGLGGSHVIVSVPIMDESNRFSGVLAGALRLGETTISPLYATIVRLRLGQSGGTYLVDGNGSVLFDSAAAAVGLPFSEYVLPYMVLSSQGGAERTVDASANDVVAAYSPVPGTSWTLILEDDWRNLTGETRRYLNLLVALLGVGMALPMIGAVLLIRSRHTERSEQDYGVQTRHAAHTVKQSLLPGGRIPVLPGWKITVHCEESASPGGSFHDFMLLPDGCLMLVVGDTGTTGLEASLLFATTRATLRAVARWTLSPAQALERANESLAPETRANASVACFYGVVEPVHGILDFANAGYTAAWHVQDDSVAEFPVTGEPLGMALAAKYDQEQRIIRPGELLLFCSTEVTEALDRSSDGAGGLVAWDIIRGVCGPGDEVVASIRQALEAAGGAGPNGATGATVIVVERLAPDASNGQQPMDRVHR